jgi:precorrin-6B methylase 1
MIANKTYNNAIDTLKSLGEQHEQISTTTTGDIWRIDMNETLFPLFHINPVNVETGLSSLTYNFQLFVMDAVTERENWTEANFQSADNLSNGRSNHNSNRISTLEWSITR